MMYLGCAACLAGWQGLVNGFGAGANDNGQHVSAVFCWRKGDYKNLDRADWVGPGW